MQSSASSKTPSIKRDAQLKSKPNVATVSANSKADSLEIEEISKKISEHADALYRTWKSRGLVPPADILEFYTVEAAAAGTSKEALQSTEGLQKLVNTFVIKDKELRSNGGGVGGVGKQATSKKSSSCNSQISKLGSTTPSTKTEIKAATTKTNTSKVNRKFHENVATNLSFKTPSQNDLQQQELHKSSHVINMQKQQLQQQQPCQIDGRYASIFTPEKVKTAKTTEDVFDRFNKPTTTTINTLNNKNTKMKTIKMSDKMGATNTPIIKSQSFTSSTHTGSLGSATLSNIMSSIQQPSALTSATTTNSTNILNKNLNFDIDLDLKFDINLNVQQLSQLQTHNLKKIKELLQDSNAKTPTRIPTPANSALSSHAREKKPLKITTSLVDDLKQQQQQQQQQQQPQQQQNNLKDETNFADNREKKKSRELQADIMPNKEKDALMRQLSVQWIYVDNENDVGYSNGTSKRQNVARKLMDPDSAVTITTKPTNSSPLLHANNQLIAPPTAVCHTQSDIESVIAPLNTSSQGTNASQVDSTTIQNATTNKSNKTIKSTATTTTTTKAKDHKLKDISNTINQTPSARQSKEDTPITTTTTLPLSPSSPLLAPAPTSSETAVASLISNMEVARNSSSNNNSITAAASTMPTPTKLKSPRNPLSNGQEKNLRSNFFTRGSVAERVLMFEKCPDVRHAFLNIKRPEIVEAPKVQVKVKLHTTPPPPPQDHTSLQREYRALKSVYIPRFYFPHGKPQPQIAVERTLRGILSAFDTFPNNQVTKDELPRILKICGLPFYWRMPVVIFCQQSNGLVERQRFVEFWKQMNVYCHEEASRFIYILSRGQRYRNYILPEDLVPLVQDVVDTHPGLAFLKEATEFHSRYVHTVIARIFYSVNRSWSGKISMSELKKSDLLEILCLLEEEDDINQIMAFFSYEHFYVIYCKFWELDKDHDLLINQDDLARHSDHALSTRIIERIFSGCVTRNDNRKHVDDEPKMSYTDFVWFLLSEEDKRTPTAIEYWFRCMDLDGDGALSMYELEYFYEEQQQRMESIGIESLPFEDCLCQMLDMIKPQRRDAITLGDLKKCKMTHVFFDTFFNLEKYLDHEQRDPFATQRDEYSSDWDRFAAQEYELLITEEND